MMDRKSAFKQIVDDAGKGELVFPTGTMAALNIHRALDDPGISIERVAKLVQGEPLLAARIVAVANSVSFNRSGKSITDIRSAIGRLGFSMVRTLATAIATQNLASTSKHRAHRLYVDQLWRHTAHVAALAYVIAHRITHQNPDAALFAGIVHEVGTFYLLANLERCPELLAGEPEEWQDEYEPLLGRVVLNALGVPDSIKTAIEVMWQGYLTYPPASFGDTLLLADQLAPIESPLHRSDSETNPMPDRAVIESTIGNETLASILEESNQEVESLSAALAM